MIETIQLDENLPQNATLLKMDQQIRTGYERQNAELFCYLDLFVYNREQNAILMKELGLDSDIRTSYWKAL